MKSETLRQKISKSLDDGPLGMADDKETANLLRKHGGKTGAELKAEGK